MHPDDWLRRQTYHHRDFSPGALVEAKQASGQRISLAIPTLNEAATIGNIVTCLHKDLINDHPLLDELFVIDSGSTDQTLQIARDAGASVLDASTILPAEGHLEGKGENLWKAGHALSGDILLFVDGDISNFHSGFATGLLGPLLNNPDIHFTKAFYERPINGDSLGLGGGRVTEILIRPLLNLFFPELTAFVQPLSGEYAIRRSLFETLPMPSGYGVETGNLIDISRRIGLAGMAQVDLEERKHRNRPVSELGTMSFAILQTLLRRLSPAQRASNGLPLTTPTTTLHAIENTPNGPVRTTSDANERERPPLIKLAAYRQRRRAIEQSQAPSTANNQE